METSNAALRAKNDEAAARELRELREDTLKGLRYTLELVSKRADSVRGNEESILHDAIEVITMLWEPAS